MNNSEYVKRWRQQTKQKIIESMGGECQICGYSKCSATLDIHHINSEEKEFSFSRVRANPKAWRKIVEELKKCIMLCANCHREVHAGITEVPTVYASVNPDVFVKNKPKRICEICNENEIVYKKFCSIECSKISQQKVDWDAINLPKLFSELKTNTSVAKHLNVSDVTVAKHKKRILG